MKVQEISSTEEAAFLRSSRLRFSLVSLVAALIALIFAGIGYASQQWGDNVPARWIFGGCAVFWALFAIFCWWWSRRKI